MRDIITKKFRLSLAGCKPRISPDFIPCQKSYISVIWVTMHCLRWLITYTGLILGLHPANERHCDKVTLSVIGWESALPARSQPGTIKTSQNTVSLDKCNVPLFSANFGVCVYKEEYSYYTTGLMLDWSISIANILEVLLSMDYCSISLFTYWNYISFPQTLLYDPASVNMGIVQGWF